MSSKDPPAGRGVLLGGDFVCGVLGLERLLLVVASPSASSVLALALEMMVLLDLTVRLVGMAIKGVELDLLALLWTNALGFGM